MFENIIAINTVNNMEDDNIYIKKTKLANSDWTNEH